MKPHIWTAAATLLLTFAGILIARTAVQDVSRWPIVLAGLFIYVACLILVKKSK